MLDLDIYTRWVLISTATFLLSWMLLFRRLFGRSWPPGTRLPPSVPGASITGHHEMHKYDFFCTAAMKWARQYGPVYRLRQNFASIVILNDFDSIKKFYSRKEFLNRSRFWVMKSDRYEGLATMNGTIWNLNRRFCLHALRDFGMGKSYAMEDIVEEFQCACNEIAKTKGEPIAFYDYIMPCASNNISAIVYGRRFSYDHPARAEINRLINDMLAAISFGRIYQHNPLFVAAITKRIPGTHVNLVRQKVDDLALYAYEKIKEHKTSADNHVNRDFVDAYLKKVQDRDDDSRDHFTVETLVGMVTSFLLAGTASTAGTIHWHMVKNAMEPDTLQARIQREIDEVIGRERPPKWEDRLHMPFTMASVWEMDRWKTSTPLGVPREASEDTIVDDFFIPKGTVIMANFWAAHFDVNFWKDPEKFDPTRFLNDDGTLMTRKPECLLPFSFGKRTCPGEILATVEIFLAVTSLLQRFHVLPAGKLPFDINSPSILAGHVQRLKLRFIDRNQGL
uniref:Putative cytochrome n=1 Tax=Rhipicephalus microplus TaxID=6941 RepID=A0A6M2CT60_RHIMP